MEKRYEGIFDLREKVALVIGGAGGLGEDMALALAERGADIAIASRRAESSTELAATIESLGRRCILANADITDEQSVLSLASRVDAAFGKLDILVNSAGMNVLQKAEDYTSEHWDKVLDLNLRGAYLVCREAGKLMKRGGRGKIVNISSVRGQLGMPEGYIAYCASKGGLDMLTKCLAVEWAKYDITVNGIAPTFIRTSINAKQLDDKAFYDKLVNRIPLGRIGQQRDLIGALLLFVSPASDFITGQILTVDGGLTAAQ